MSPITERAEQSESPMLHARALSKFTYEDRPAPRPHKSKTGGNVAMTFLPAGLEPCGKCDCENRTIGGWIRPEDLNCDCDCGFIVPDEVARSACDYEPGSPEKMAVIAARYRLGVQPFHPGDRTEHRGELVEIACEVDEEYE